MFEIIKLLLDVCQIKKGPQSLPYSPWLFRFLILAYAVISFAVLRMSASFFQAAVQVAIETVLVIISSWFMLFVTRRLPRFYQTTSALLGTDAVISFCALPALAAMMMGWGNIWVFFLIIGLMIWHWVVTGHIIRHALDQTWPFSLGLAFLYLLTAYQVMALLAPVLPNAN
ncbi:MAG: hypothetical protein WC782_08895 [Methylococcaceae bacterium]|jgi:hypothetical protein